jgi:hypothetical protein
MCSWSENSKMRTVHDPIKTLQKELETWGTPFVELDCFGTDCAERIADTMDEFCRAHLGSKLVGTCFMLQVLGAPMASGSKMVVTLSSKFGLQRRQIHI